MLITFIIATLFFTANKAYSRSDSSLTNQTIDEVTIKSVISNLSTYGLSDVRITDYITQLLENSLLGSKTVYHYKQTNLNDLELSIDFIIDDDLHDFNSTIRWYVVVLKDNEIYDHAKIAEYQTKSFSDFEKWRISRFRNKDTIEVRDYQYFTQENSSHNIYSSFLFRITNNGKIDSLERDFSDSPFFHNIALDSLFLQLSRNEQDIAKLISFFPHLQLPFKIDYQLISKPLVSFPIDEAVKRDFPYLRIRILHNAKPTNNYSIYPLGQINTTNSIHLIYCVEFHDFDNFRIVNHTKINKLKMRTVHGRMIAYYEKTPTHATLRESFISENLDLNYFDMDINRRKTISLLD